MQSNRSFPEEIIVDILSRLPAKSVGRCRCVSKSWRALLSHPDLITTHLRWSRNLREESLVLISDTGSSLWSASLSNAHHLFDEITIPATQLSFADHSDSWVQVHAYCDGLLLIGDKEDKTFVLNPVTGEIREVPRSPFALDPHESFIMYGLGYDLVANDYKIVTLSHYDTDNEHGIYLSEDEPCWTDMYVNVYSLKTGVWKRAESSPYDHAVGYVTSGIYVNGCIHWLASRVTDYKSAIVAFDLVEEKFREVPPPSSVDSRRFVFNCLAALGGNLCMFKETETNLWVMKEYAVQESWTTFTVNDPEKPEIRPLCMLGQDELVLLKDEEKLAVYNLKEETLKSIVVHGIPDDVFAKASFVESLVSPHGTNIHQRE